MTGTGDNDLPGQDATAAWTAHYRAVSKRRSRHQQPQTRGVKILGHRVTSRTLLPYAALALAAGAILIAALLLLG